MTAPPTAAPPPQLPDVEIRLNQEHWTVDFAVMHPLAINPFHFSMPVAALKHAMGHILVTEAQIEQAMRKRMSQQQIVRPGNG